MSNKYGLPDDKLKQIRLRDTDCVYCHKKMIKPSDLGWRGDWATIEHLNFLPPWNSAETVAICCGSCNSSRGDKPLPRWFDSSYCRERKINAETVSEPVKEYLKSLEV